MYHMYSVRWWFLPDGVWVFWLKNTGWLRQKLFIYIMAQTPRIYTNYRGIDYSLDYSIDYHLLENLFNSQYNADLHSTSFTFPLGWNCHYFAVPLPIINLLYEPSNFGNSCNLLLTYSPQCYPIEKRCALHTLLSVP